MNKFRNKKETKKVGNKISQLRKAGGYNIADIADMTGFSIPMISNIEKGEECTLSYLIEIAKAIGVHPKELLDVKFEKQPRFKLSPQRQDRSRATERIMELIEQSDFFNTPRFVRDVLKTLNDKAKTKLNSTLVSTTLRRMEQSGYVKSELKGRQKLYFKKKK